MWVINQEQKYPKVLQPKACQPWTSAPGEGARHSQRSLADDRTLLSGKMLALQRQTAFPKCLKTKPVPRLKLYYLFQNLEQVDQGPLPRSVDVTENQAFFSGV